jgi:hypothetical protein
MHEGPRVIHAMDGGAPRTRIVLRPGEFRPPVTFGPQGDYVPNEEACLPIRARMYFDGATLFAASVDPVRPVRANGIPLSTAWTPIPFPAVLEIGASRLLYENAWNEEQRTVTVQSPAEESEALTRVVQAREGDALTRVWTRGALSNILDRERAACASVMPSTARAAPSSLELAAGEQEPSTVIGPPPVGPLAFRATTERLPSALEEQTQTQSAARPSVLRTLGLRAREQYARMSRGTRRALLILPIMAWAVYSMRGPEPEAPASPARRPALSASAASASAAFGGALATAPPSPEASAGGATHATLPAPAPASPRASEGARGYRTTEARAIDAAARGAYAEAAELYDRLAEQYPERREFASAARILRARHPTGGP